VVRGVLSISGGSPDVQVDAVDIETDDGPVLMVTVRSGEKRAVGAAFVEYGRPYALAVAALGALSDL
jgi:hypothetical protein